MCGLTRLIPLSTLVWQAPVVAVSLLIAELFYKFHSFTLECIAFLATWYVIDAGVHVLAEFRRTILGIRRASSGTGSILQ